MLQVVHTVERVLQRLGDVVLYILGAGATVGRHHHDGVGLDVGHEIDTQPRKREEAHHRYRHEDDYGRYRVVDR